MNETPTIIVAALAAIWLISTPTLSFCIRRRRPR